jgi:signal transduction histidine kinase
LPIDSFFRSLADDQGEKAIGIILSGTGTDGTLGIRAIHGAGGTVMVQTPSSARYTGMPDSGVQTGLADFVLPPQKMALQLKERSRVAGDVHDSFASLLCAIKDELQPLLGKGEDDRLNQVFYQLDIAIRDAIRIQMALRPPVLDDLGLLPALDALRRKFQENHSNIHVGKKFLLKNEVPDSIEVPIYRIAEEAFDNIAAHSGADSVTISLARKDSLIELVIQDNGHGFNVEKMLSGGTGRGLSVMRERADLSGGLFDIESEPGKGTTLRVSWPFA